MTTSDNSPFFETIYTLRKSEEVVLYQEIFLISSIEEQKVKEFLEMEYYQEALEYPDNIPSFDSVAAIWAAKFFYFAAQFIIYRKTSGVELANFLQSYTGEITPSSVLSVDLTFRFLPQILEQSVSIDPEDPILLMLETQMKIWTYSSIGTLLKIENIELETVLASNVLKQMYVDRIIQTKSRYLVKHAALKDLIMTSLGNYASTYWPELVNE